MYDNYRTMNGSVCNSCGITLTNVLIDVGGQLFNCMCNNEFTDTSFMHVSS